MMGELIVILMVIIFCVGMGIVVKDALQHDDKNHIKKNSDE